MSQELATYSFLPWLRRGIAALITSEDNAKDDKNRGKVPVVLQLSGHPVNVLEHSHLNPRLLTKDIWIQGPGDIKAINPNQVVKTEPRSGVTNFEPNYLPHIEFYDEDFPWRYTPAKADTKRRLRPWIMLVVLAEGEFEPETDVSNRPLPYIVCDKAASVFPPADELWAWAHVHVNNNLTGLDIVSEDPTKAVVHALDQDPDLAYSRILCPRRLEPNSGYHAFLMPVFETGRLAGLGLDPKSAPWATFSAWADYPNKPKDSRNYYPYYYRWYFRTGTVGDFEYLLRLLQPKPADPRVGRRDMDVHNPGADLPGIDGEVSGVLKLGGALRVPGSPTEDEEWNCDLADPLSFSPKLAKLINLADDYSVLDDVFGKDTDPVITPPLYGRWHALAQRLLEDSQGTPDPNQNNWVHKLNLDPRFRVAAGFGTRVVQQNQEEYMNAAWEQVGQILEANRRIRQAQLAVTVSASWYERHFVPLKELDPMRFLILTAPVHKRVVAGGLTVHHTVGNSRVPLAAFSAAMRRMLRPGGRLAKASGTGEPSGLSDLIHRINEGQVQPFLEKQTPAVCPTGQALKEDLKKRLEEKGYDHDEDVVVGVVDIILMCSLPKDRPTENTDKDLRYAKARAQMPTMNCDGDSKPPQEVDESLADAVLDKLDPRSAIPTRLQIGDWLKEAMAYPEFDIPMYGPLKDISADLFLPNINCVEQNSITLLETNQPFIESYMVGLNHEFARELLWREYPTDQRGSYFRQFWDITSYLDITNTPAGDLREKLKDIPPLHTWKPDSELGDHDQRELKGAKEEEVVLVIRGELLKKYPTAVIYAHRARWQLKDGSPDKQSERELELRTKTGTVKMPLYQAKVDPDIYFLGFDLTVEAARGEMEGNPDDPGWFFVIEERPGEPRFGLDADERKGPLQTWNDLSWKDMTLEGNNIRVWKKEMAPLNITIDIPTGDDKEKERQWNDDKNLGWGETINAADLAYILYQPPVVVAVHAAELLLPPKSA